MSHYEYAPTPSSASSHKVAIPRLQHRAGQATSSAKDRRRVSRACTACRSHKIKCTGDQPSCRHCENSNRECVYILPRKDRVKILTDRCVQLAGLLSALKTRVGNDEALRIDSLLVAAEQDVSDIRRAPAPLSSIGPDSEEPRPDLGNLDVSPQPPDGRDNTGLDLLDEDLLQDERAQATGFVGMSSEAQWLRTIMAQLDRADNNIVPAHSFQRRYSTYGLDMGNIDKVSSFTFSMDGDSVDLDHFVDPHELPTPETAEMLLDCYADTVHESFPILPKRALLEFRRYFKQMRNGNPFRLSPKWQAMLNLILAIGARYSHLVQASWQEDERDHVVYQARARAFGLNEFALTNHPDVPQIQVAGLLSFYYLSVGQISRSWIVMGTALRFANALGLHVRNEDPSASPTKRELFVRIWWSLYSLERLLSVVTGRPSVIVDSTCSVPFPIPVPEEQLSDDFSEMERLRKTHSTTPVQSPTTSHSFHNMPPPTLTRASNSSGHAGSYFNAIVELGIITQNILTSLYSAGTMIRSLEGIHQNIVQLGQGLDGWANSLPWEFNVTHSPSEPQRRERMILGMYYRSAKILLTRPCIGGLGHGGSGSGFLEGFARRTAAMCVNAAKVTVDCLPDQPNPRFLYENGPWWCSVHHLMQALSVFLLALVFMAPSPQEIAALAPYIRKIVHWLHAMQDPVAEKAYQVAVSAVDTVGNSLSIDLLGVSIAQATVVQSTPRDHLGFLDGKISLSGEYPSFVPCSTEDGLGSVPMMDPLSGPDGFQMNAFLVD